MKTNTTRCLTALLVAGVGLSACQTVPMNYSTSFNGGESRPSNTSLFRGTFDADAPATVEDALAPSIGESAATAGELLADIRPQILDANLQCVPFARDKSGVDIRGNANKWWKLAAGKYTRSSRPQQGSVFVMRGYKTARRGHVAVVKQILDERTIVVDHANWGNDGRIWLSAPIRDESAKNDWSKVRVWYTPTNQWGRRLYRAKGFIYPTTSVAGGGSFALGSN